jgi:chaperone modulatory protein CbpM
MNDEELAPVGRSAREGPHEGLPGWPDGGSSLRSDHAPSPASHGRCDGVIVEERMLFTLLELSHACGTDGARLCELVDEGVLAPIGDDPRHWQFEGSALQRARKASRLASDLALSTAATALVLELLDEIDALRSKSCRCGLS